MFAGKKSAQIREILISESAWEEMTCLFAPSKEIICKALPLPVDDKSLSEVLHQVGLGKLAARIHDHDRWGDILSSGEKQRIALARLILRRPKWIFLDETTSHLEEQEAIRLLRLVREKLPTSGVIMVTHQPGVWNLADDICDISAVL